jgi:GNAT superfamily N-acetyltransferase
VPGARYRSGAVTIRRASLSDFAAVADLLEELGRGRVTHETYAACRAIYAAQLAAPSTDHLVTVDERGNVVGFCSLHYRSRLNRPRPQAWIPDLVVSRAARGRGTARAMLDEAEALARERGCWELTLESGHERREAHLLYTAAGMQEVGRTFRKGL